MRRALVLIAGFAAAYGSDATMVLTSRGTDRVAVGITMTQLEKVLRVKLRTDMPCMVVGDVTTELAGLSYLVEDKHVTRVNVDYYETAAAPVRTEEGIGLGATEDQVKAAYGSRLRVEPNRYDPTWHYLVVDDPDHMHAIIFETNGNKVTSFHAGEYPSVAYTEGCR